MMNNYKTNFKNYIKRISNSHYIFELTKCCGYGEFMVICKDLTLADLYMHAVLEFCLPIEELYIEGREKLIIPNTETITIRQFILDNPTLFKPIYPIDAKVVYKLWYNDGYPHQH